MNQKPASNMDLVNDLCSGCCSPDKYCTLKEVLVRAPRDARTMVQIKCIEKFKYERSKRDKKDIGWNEAVRMWIDEGYADRFVEGYREGVRLDDLYYKVSNLSEPMG